jgi:predicted MFS family arabinose efflux permease
VAGRWLLLAVLTTSYGAGAFGMLGISPLSPTLVEGFALSRLQVALIVPSIYLGGLFFSLPGGRLADRLGVRTSFLGGLALGAAGLAAGAWSPGFPAFLACLFVVGIGWSVVNPALGRAIIDLFPVRERRMAMGIKQMGLTLGGVASALVLPSIAAALGWRAAIVTCSVVVALPVALTWRVLESLGGGVTAAGAGGGPAARGKGHWAWLGRPALLVFFATGLVLGMVQAAVLSYLPLYAVQGLGFDAIGAGLLVACSQAGGAVSRLALGAASDRWLIGQRSLWLALTSAVGAIIFAAYAAWPVSTAGAGGRAGVRERRGSLRLGGSVLRHQRRGGRPPRGRPAERRRVRGDRRGAAGGAGDVRTAARALELLRGGVGRVRRAGDAGHGGDGGGQPGDRPRARAVLASC